MTECPHADFHPVVGLTCSPARRCDAPAQVAKLTLCDDEETNGVFILDPGKPQPPISTVRVMVGGRERSEQLEARQHPLQLHAHVP